MGLVGTSGSGKSTLARLLCLIHKQESGQILFRGQDIWLMNRKQYYQQMHMVFQDPLASFPARMKVERYVLEPFRYFNLLKGKNPKQLAAELVERVCLPAEILSRYPNQLSGGQLQRIVFARAIGIDPSFVICDEATSALDATIQQQIIQLFQELQHTIGFAALFITHDLALAESICDTIYVMHNGAIVETLISDNIGEEAQHEVTLTMVRASCRSSEAALGTMPA